MIKLTLYGISHCYWIQYSSLYVYSCAVARRGMRVCARTLLLHLGLPLLVLLYSSQYHPFSRWFSAASNTAISA